MCDSYDDPVPGWGRAGRAAVPDPMADRAGPCARFAGDLCVPAPGGVAASCDLGGCCNEGTAGGLWWCRSRGQGGRHCGYGSGTQTALRPAGPGMGSELRGPDAAEVEFLVIRVADDLYRRAVRDMQGDRAAAEDLVQEVFHAAVRSWGKIRKLPLDQQRAWLFVVLRHKFVDHSRACQRLEPAGHVPRLDRVADDVDRVALSNVVLERCWKVIQKMPPVQHRVAVLRWGENWTAKEIAEVLGMTQSTVREVVPSSVELRWRSP